MKRPPNQNFASEEDAQNPFNVLRDKKKILRKETSKFVCSQGMPAASLPRSAARHKSLGTAWYKLRFLRTQSHAVTHFVFKLTNTLFS